MSRDDEKIEEHPSYGMIGISRVTGSKKRHLFGSALPDHHTTMRIKISRGKRVINGGVEYFFGSLTNDVIEVEMSASQFAQFLTTPNVGDGVPCTIKYLDGKTIEEPPHVSSESTEVRQNFADTINSLKKQLDSSLTELKSMLKGSGSLSKADRERIVSMFSRIHTEVGSNIPWLVERFQEATDRTSKAAKAEVDAFVTSVIHSTGLEALKKISNGQQDTNLLEQKKEEE